MKELIENLKARFKAKRFDNFKGIIEKIQKDLKCKTTLKIIL